MYVYLLPFGVSLTRDQNACQVLPVALHCVGVGCAVATKIYYDFSPEVGHLESMHLIIRSRMWLFPGVFGPHKRVKRSILDARR